MWLFLFIILIIGVAIGLSNKNGNNSNNSNSSCSNYRSTNIKSSCCDDDYDEYTGIPYEDEQSYGVFSGSSDYNQSVYSSKEDKPWYMEGYEDYSPEEALDIATNDWDNVVDDNDDYDSDDWDGWD